MKTFLFSILFLSITPTSHADNLPVWIGTGGKGSLGIYRTVLDTENGKLSPVSLAAENRRDQFVGVAQQKWTKRIVSLKKEQEAGISSMGDCRNYDSESKFDPLKHTRGPD